MKTESIFGCIDGLLEPDRWPDYPGAVNGVQVEGRGTVTRIGAAVDASERILLAAEEAGVDLLLVHHGLFWDPERPMTGRRYRKLEILMRTGMALYSSHLPLDGHPEVGNCAVLMRELGWEPEARFGTWKEASIGWRTTVPETTRDALRDQVAEVVGGPVHLLAGGPEAIRRVGLVTGGGGGFIAEAADAGLDALITGEGAHHTWLDAMELGVNVYYAGHYATETWGVRALAARVSREFDVPWTFLPDPSGL